MPPDCDSRKSASPLPEDESLTDQRITENAATRAGKLLGFDESGTLKVTNEFDGDWSMGAHRLRNIIDAVEGDEPVNLAQLTSYSAGLTGLPTVTGHTGSLITNGSTVFWGGPNRTVPDPAAVGNGTPLLYSGGEVLWLIDGQNAVFDPNGVLGSGYWTTSLTRFSDINGPHWTPAGGLAGATFNHIPTVAGEIPCAAGRGIAISANIYALGMISGTVTLAVRFHDAAHALLSESATVAVALPGTVAYNYSIAVNTPASTAYVVPVIKFDNVTCAPYGIIVKNLKVEAGYYATPFSDVKTLGLAYGAAAHTYWGTGYATPIVTIGDATATTAQLDLRSAAGAQAYDVRLQSAGGTSGSDGKGLLTVTAKRVAVSGPVGAVAEYDAGNSGAAITIDFGTNGQYQKVTLNAATPAITVSTTGLVVGKYQLRILQDGTGSRAPTFAGFTNANCLGNVAPTIASGANAVTFLNLYWDGSAFWVSSNPWD